MDNFVPQAPGPLDRPYAAPATSNPIWRSGVRFEASLVRSPTLKATSVGYLRAFKKAGIANLRFVAGENPQIMEFRDKYGDLADYITTPMERFSARVILGGVQEVCVKFDDNLPTIALTTWERGKIPQYVIGQLNKFLGVWVPTNDVRDQYVAAGLTIPIHVVQPALEPLGASDISTRAYKAFTLISPEALRDDAFHVVQAFVQSFTRDQPVLLRVATPQANWPPLRKMLSSLPEGSAMVEPTHLDLDNDAALKALLHKTDYVALCDLDGGWEYPKRLALTNGVPVIQVVRKATTEVISRQLVDDRNGHLVPNSLPEFDAQAIRDLWTVSGWDSEQFVQGT